MQTVRARIGELEALLEQTKKEQEMHLAKWQEAKDKALRDMDNQCRREIAKRDEAVMQSRRDYLNLKKRSAEEVASVQAQAQTALSQLERHYEQKLAQEAQYVDRMKQAYDEALLHAQLDQRSVAEKTQVQIATIEAQRQQSLAEAEKQKLAVLAYYEYLNERHNEVLSSLEENQAEERVVLKSQLAEAKAALQQLQQQGMAAEVQYSRTVTKYEADKQRTELELLKVRNDVDWANDRISKLEDALASATQELKLRTERVEKAEIRAAESAKRADDLEKIRRTLVTQLEILQGDAAPKDADLKRLSDRLAEMTREYETAIAALAEKEQKLTQKTQNIALLQKQVRELRQTAAQKEGLLQRTGTLFQEFLFAMQEARFLPPSSLGTTGKKDSKASGEEAVDRGAGPEGNDESKRAALAPKTAETAAALLTKQQKPATASKKSLSASDPLYVVSSLQLAPHAEDKLSALYTLLQHVSKQTDKESGEGEAVIDEVEAARREQERHVSLLHRNIASLQRSLETTQALTATKVHNHLSDNEVLLREVNALRSEIKALSLENQRLLAQQQQQQQLQATQLRKQSLVSSLSVEDLGSNRQTGHQTAAAALFANNNSLSTGHRSGSPLTLPRLTAPSLQAAPADESDVLVNSNLSADDKVAALIRINVEQIRQRNNQDSHSPMERNTSLSASTGKLRNPAHRGMRKL